ncbi:MAG: hypothetical protein V1750_10335 [Acidobacteriota bacterium]
MLTGYNTDIEFEGVTYHVQSEDRGGANPLIETLVYVKGEILATRRTEYRDLLEAGGARSTIQALMERQHRAVAEAVRSGRLDLLTEPQVGAESDTTVVRRGPSVVLREGAEAWDAAPHSQRTLDEVIAEWLVEQQQGERLRLLVTGGGDLRLGAPFSLDLQVRTSPGESPVAGAHVTARFLSTSTKPLTLAEGQSDAAGILLLRGQLPEIDRGTALVVVTVQHASGSDEAKFLVKR